MDRSVAEGAPVVTAWSAVSPFGIGRDAFTTGVRAGASTARALGGEHGVTPVDEACLVPGFDVRAVLGRNGTRNVDRVSGLALAAARELLPQDTKGTEGTQGSADDAESRDRDDTAVVLATSGTVQEMRDFTRSSLLETRPFYVNPGAVPSGVPNCAAGLVAIWHRLRGPNATITTGRTAGLHALAYARRLLTAGRARQVVVGASEEYSAMRAWLEFHHHAPAPPGVLGEGSALFLLERWTRHSPPPLVAVLGVESQVCLDGDVEEALRRCLLEGLRRHGISPDEVWAASTSHAAGDLGRQERAAVTSLFGEQPLTRVPDLTPIGETGSATGAFQVAAVLSRREPAGEGAGRIAVVTSVDSGGTLGCGLFRLLPSR
ncbi:beta-ketoacyl synthase N-terminal-like domain-containing protein [Streptoalloteichus hindustanus]|uniref:3-oxoacyl-[acyl-carrier-protein] synthase II n=1 Tax=Streptoalloteichus hindustanus TaxID=2017 RepID=A0A1M5P2L8_STRHI|nr:beta-ketoacyl synthase N-terminal-like domain-containing protein [Streptoalloteichus hindustanus]SHG96051.1 3-oxoacyl-[acyl-carrier-protein] synthase II [Streptoalloteichus hindustanus]